MDQKLADHAQVMIFKLELETQQEQFRSDQFFESIKHIEQDTNKFRNNYIKECNEKDEFKGDYSKLDEQYKKQAGEISRLKHTSQEKELELQLLSDKEDAKLKERAKLVKTEADNNDRIAFLNQEISKLKEKSSA